MSQEITIRGRARQNTGSQCVNMTIRVLGRNGEKCITDLQIVLSFMFSVDAQADRNMMAVQMQFNSLYRGDPCSGCVLVPSVLLLLGLALATLFAQF